MPDASMRLGGKHGLFRPLITLHFLPGLGFLGAVSRLGVAFEMTKGYSIRTVDTVEDRCWASH